MKYKIRHEQKWILITVLISVLLFFVFVITTALRFPIWLLFADLAVLILSMLLYFLEQIAGTSLQIEEKSVTIRHLLRKQKITVSEISDLQIEPYQRMRRRGGSAAVPDYRMRMTITRTDGKKIILTDKASESGLTFGNPRRLPDSEVPLYMAYEAIQAMR